MQVESIYTSTIFFQTLPEPVEKEFTLRVCGQTSHAIGVGGPQFLRYFFLEEQINKILKFMHNFVTFCRVVLKPDEFRLCGAFSHDIKFF